MTIPVTTGDRLELPLLAGEKWWGGAVADGQAMPMGASAHRRNLATSAGFLDDDTAGANQSAPLLVSSRGRYVWSESPFEFAFDGAGGLVVVGSELVLGRAEATLGGAFRAAAAAHFPAAGRTVATPMLAAPQYNTWIEMPYRPTQDAVLAYVRGLLDVSDQFLLGSDLLCAPVLARDAGSRHVVVPPGRWRGADGHVTEGPAEVEVAVTLASVPLWRCEHAG